MNDDENTNADRNATVLPEREPDRTEETPRESEASALARHHDPSLTAQATEKDAAKNARAGVEWVRPTDLMASHSARMAGRGIDFHAELARRARRMPGSGVRAGVRFVSERARKLPPVTAFGRGGGERFSRVSRSGIGLG